MYWLPEVGAEQHWQVVSDPPVGTWGSALSSSCVVDIIMLRPEGGILPVSWVLPDRSLWRTAHPSLLKRVFKFPCACVCASLSLSCITPSFPLSPLPVFLFLRPCVTPWMATRSLPSSQCPTHVLDGMRCPSAPMRVTRESAGCEAVGQPGRHAGSWTGPHAGSWIGPHAGSWIGLVGSGYDGEA